MTKTSSRRVYCAAAAGAVLLAAVACLAGPLLPNACIVLSGTTVAARPELAGTVLRDDLTPFEIYDGTGTLIYQGQLQDRVMRSTARGTLVFSFRIRDTDPTLGGSIIGAYLTGYTEGATVFATDVDYRLDGLGDVGPGVACRGTGGDDLYFDFSNDPVVSGIESYFVFALTDTTKHAQVGTITLFTEDFSFVTLKCSAPRQVP